MRTLNRAAAEAALRHGVTGGDRRHRLRPRRPRRGHRPREPAHARDRAQRAAAPARRPRARAALPGGRAQGEPPRVRAAASSTRARLDGGAAAARSSTRRPRAACCCSCPRRTGCAPRRAAGRARRSAAPGAPGRVPLVVRGLSAPAPSLTLSRARGILPTFWKASSEVLGARADPHHGRNDNPGMLRTPCLRAAEAVAR